MTEKTKFFRPQTRGEEEDLYGPVSYTHLHLRFEQPLYVSQFHSSFLLPKQMVGRLQLFDNVTTNTYSLYPTKFLLN